MKLFRAGVLATSLCMAASACIPPPPAARSTDATTVTQSPDRSVVAAAQAGTSPELVAVSNRAGLISGDDVLVEVTTGGTTPGSITLELNGSVVGDVEPGVDGRYVHLVEGLDLGPNTLRATVADRAPLVLSLHNHPSGGPVFSGPQIQPWKCQKGAIDKQCNQPVRYDFHYRSRLFGRMLPYDPANPPLDVDTTTTQTGKRVPFVVREEVGFLDRSEYRIATLFDPTRPWDARDPQPTWNRKMLVTHGGGCGVAYKSTGAPDVVRESISVLGQLILPDASNMDALGKGFLIMSTALDDAGDNCNIATQAESVMMAKERVVERYGALRFTIGAGCSGGALAIQQVSNAYPGIYDGLVAQCSFPDAGSAATQIVDYDLLLAYYGNHLAENGLDSAWTLDQFSAVLGDVSPLNALISDAGYLSGVRPGAECDGVEPASWYHATRNPGGVRCTIADFSINILGPREPDQWGDVERSLDRGFADFPIDNVGVQYGLKTLRAGVITPEQFLDLNAKIGGFDVDLDRRTERTVASERVLANAYRSGGLNVGNNLADVPILHLVGPNPGFAHDAFRAWAMRSRLDREFGHHRNNVIWYGPIPVLGQLDFMKEGIAAMDGWLEAIEVDTTDVQLSEKVVAARPPELLDSCRPSVGAGLGYVGEIVESRRQFVGVDSVLAHPLAGPQVATALESGGTPSLDAGLGMIIDRGNGLLCGPGASSPDFETVNWGTPRMVAGHDITGDDSKCQLRPVGRDENYGPTGFTPGQWELFDAVFPHGVCDTAAPGVAAQATVPWMRYGDAATATFGGEAMALGEAPRGWRSGN